VSVGEFSIGASPAEVHEDRTMGRLAVHLITSRQHSRSKMAAGRTLHVIERYPLVLVRPSLFKRPSSAIKHIIGHSMP